MGSVDDLKTFCQDITGVIADFWGDPNGIQSKCESNPGFLLDRLPLEAPVEPDQWTDVVDDVKNLVIPNIPHVSSPNSHDYVEVGTSAPTIAADQLAAALVTPNPLWNNNPISTELEMRTTDWLGRMIGLPEEFLFSSGKGNGGGVIQESASGSCILMLLAAKSRALKRLQKVDPTLDPYSVSSKFVAFASNQAHRSFEKSGVVTGIRFEILPTDDTGVLRGSALQEAVAAAKRKSWIPIFLGATLGTTETLAFDSISELGPICQEEDIWLHVDAAIAGSLFVCPEYRFLMKGVEMTDSFNCGPHKTMLVSPNCSVLWVKDRETVEGLLPQGVPFIKHGTKQNHVDYTHWSFNNLRPFRSLKLWFVLRMYGVSGIQRHIRKQCRLLHELEDMVMKDDRFEICSQVIYSHVCFRLKNASQHTMMQLFRDITDCSEVTLNITVFKGKAVLRFAVCNTFTESKHISYAWEQIQRAANAPDVKNEEVQ